MATLRARQSKPKELQFEWPDLSSDQHTMVFDPHRILWIATGTKTGKTVAGAVWISQGIALGERCAWIGPYHKRTRTGFDHVASAFAGAAANGLARIHTGNEMQVFLPSTKGVLECFSGDNPSSIYGEAFDRVFVDEATRQPSPVYPAVLSTITATKGKARFAFNLDQGRRHWAVQGFLNAKSGLDPEHGYVFLPTSRSPYVDKGTIDIMRRSLPARVFAALYEGEIQEDGAGVFRNVESLHEGVLENPSTGHDYVIGLDLARKNDYSVAIVMDVRRRHIVAFERMHNEPWMLQIERIAKLATRYNNALVIPDATGLGDVIVAALSEAKVRLAPVVLTSGQGLTHTGIPKSMLIQQLMVAVENRTFTYPECLETLTEELKSFEYDTTNAGNIVYSAPEGMNDDCVIAAALVIWGARNASMRPMAVINSRYRRRAF